MGKSGIWKAKENGEIVYSETDLDTKETIEKSPEDMGLVKQADFDLFFVKESEDPNEFEIKTKTYFVQHVKMRIREAFNLWLKCSDRKFFVTDILNGMTIRAPFESDSNLIVEKSRPKKVSLEDVKEAMKDKTKPFYYFGKIETQNGEVTSYGITV